MDSQQNQTPIEGQLVPTTSPVVLTPAPLPLPNSVPIMTPPNPTSAPTSLTPLNSTTPDTAPTKEYKETLKFNLFVQCYTNPKEKDTFGNATRSAIKAYNLDEVTQYAYAKRWGHELATKCNFLTRDWLEANGFNFNYMIAFAVSMMQKSGNQGWWDRLMFMAEYLKDPKQKDEDKPGGNTVNIYQLGDQQVTDFNSQFLKFLETQK